MTRLNAAGHAFALRHIVSVLLLFCLGPPSPCAAAVSSQDIEFQSDGIRLSGTLFLPAETPPVAGIILVHGSGPEPRMSALGHFMASSGFAVLTYDKRGVGKSGGAYEERDNVSAVNLGRLAGDAATAFVTLRQSPGMAGIPTGFVGFSQAGWIIPIAASQVESPAFIALWSGPVCTVSEEMEYSRLADRTPPTRALPTRQELLQHMRSAGYRPDDTDPRSSLSQLAIPGLWLFGGKDRSIPVDLSIERLESLGKGQLFRHFLFNDFDHEIIDQTLPVIMEWIRATATCAAQAAHCSATDMIDSIE